MVTLHDGVFITWAYMSLSSSSLSGKVILIDAGHGGIDPGANRPGVREKDINLLVALLTRDALHHYGAHVVLTRESDVDLSDQCDNDQLKSRISVTYMHGWNWLKKPMLTHLLAYMLTPTQVRGVKVPILSITLILQEAKRWPMQFKGSYRR
jgi:hypothetical protein